MKVEMKMSKTLKICAAIAVIGITSWAPCRLHLHRPSLSGITDKGTPAEPTRPRIVHRTQALHSIQTTATRVRARGGGGGEGRGEGRGGKRGRGGEKE